MKGNSPNNIAKAGGSISIGGAIVFAVIAFFVYFAWTKVRTDNCLQNAYESYNKQWATTCKSLKRQKFPLIAPASL